MFSLHTFPNVLVTGASCAPRLQRGLTNYVKAVLALERASYDTALRVNLVSLDHMQAINAEWRGKQRPTDVLTFTPRGPSYDAIGELLFDEAAPARSLDGSRVDAEPREDCVDLGDIFICVPYMWHRCCAHPTKTLPFSQYLVAALVHAQLHAMGYDHEAPADLRAMVRREQRLGRQLRALARRYPTLLPPLDGIAYLRATRCCSSGRHARASRV